MRLRGLAHVAQEWSPVCLAHNFLKLANARPGEGQHGTTLPECRDGFWSPRDAHKLYPMRKPDQRVRRPPSIAAQTMTRTGS